MSADVLPFAASVLVGFACGSIPFGYLAGRLKGIDIRHHGSGNIGFNNVLRVAGPILGIPVLVLDIVKGLVPAALASGLGLIPALVGTGAVLGHVFTPWLGFKGGKGVATTIGVSAFLCLRSLGAGIGVYTLILLATGFVSIASVAFGLLMPLFTALIYRDDIPLLVFAAAIGLVIVLRHTGNIRRLFQGTEPRFGPWVRLFQRQR